MPLGISVGDFCFCIWTTVTILWGSTQDYDCNQDLFLRWFLLNVENWSSVCRWGSFLGWCYEAHGWLFVRIVKLSKRRNKVSRCTMDNYFIRNRIQYWGQELGSCVDPGRLPEETYRTSHSSDNQGTAVTHSSQHSWAKWATGTEQTCSVALATAVSPALNGMLALCVTTNSNNNLSHPCYCLTILMGRKKTFWLAVLQFQATSNSHLHVLWQGRVTRGRRKKSKNENKENNILKGLTYVDLREFKA